MFYFLEHQIVISFIGCILVAVLLGTVGTMVINNKLAFFSDALGHCTFTGIALGHFIGIKHYQISTILFAVLFAILIAHLVEKEKSSADTIISIFSSAGLSLGIFILTLNKNLSTHSEFFFGDILSIKKNEILGLLFLILVVFLFWIFLFNNFLISSLNKDLATSKLINFKFYRTLFMVMISILVSVTIKWVGILLINSLLTLPAAAARNISKSMQQYMIFSIFFSILSGVLGFTISYFLESSGTPVIVLFSSLIYLISHFVKKKINFC